MTYTGYDGMGYEIYVGVFFLGLWSLLFFTGLALTCAGAFLRYSGKVWQPYLAVGVLLTLLTMSAAFIDPKLYVELSGKGLFAIFIRSFILLLPLTLALFGLSLCSDPNTRLPGILFIAAGLAGIASTLPFLVDSVLKLLSGTGQPELVKLFLPYLQQFGLLRVVAEMSALVGLYSYMKQGKDLPRPSGLNERSSLS